MIEETIRDSILYDSAVQSITSKETGENCFSKMRTHAETCSGNVFTFIKECNEVEQAIKTDLGVKVSGPWRSAKSVCYTALNLGLKLTDHNGNPLGKTALQKIIKLEKEKSDYDDFGHCVLLVDKLIMQYNKLSDEQKLLIASDVCKRIKL